MSEQHDKRAHGENSGQRLKDIFTAAVELSAGERSAKLDRACSGDAALRARVEDLLRVHDAGAAFLANPTQHERAGMSTALGPITEGPGSRVGRYKILQLIGEGGFGSVFLAEQSEPVRRRVALKIIKLGMDTRSVIARFEAERQALALMDHPHIARVLDAGATDTGRPFFAMEYVTGDAVTVFANAHRLPVADRLALFAQVCSAVQHAHTKGVIHRDIKPGNVLVSMVDGKPFAKVIDFGIAKATAAPLTDKTLFTEHRQLIGTPEYMSPEQAEGSPDIDTRTDVYALGVLLYELLTGDTPFDARRLRSAAWVEMQRIIREEEPPMPSVRLMKPVLVEEPSSPQPSASPHASAAPTPRSRVGLVGHIDPRTIKGELDWIVMKALDKDRARRYETPSALAADVERHMKGEAVIAAPVSRVYRVRKFVRKHKGVVTATAAAVTALAVGGGGMAWQWREARKQRDVVISTFEQVAVDLATDDSVSGHIPEDGVYYFLGESTAQGAYGVRVRQNRSSGQPEVVYTTGNMSSTHELSRSSVPADFVGRTLRRLTYQIVNERAERTKSIDAANAQLRAQTDAAEWSAYTANLSLAQTALAAGDYPEARLRISECPELKRGWEWYHARGRADSEIARWSGTHFFAQFLPNGKAVLTNQYTNSPFLITFGTDTKSQRTDRLVGHTSLVTGGIVSADGRRIATGGLSSESDGVRLWTLTENGSFAQSVLIPIRRQISGLSFDNSGTRLAIASTDGTIRIVDPRDGQTVCSLRSPTKQSTLLGVEFSADGGKLLVTGGAQGTFTFGTPNAPQFAPLVTWSDNSLYNNDFDSSGTRVVGSVPDSNDAVVWSVRPDDYGRELAVLRGHTAKVHTPVFGPGDKLIFTLSYDRTVRVWHAAPDRLGECAAILRGHVAPVQTIAFNEDGTRAATGDYGGRLIVWNIDPASAGFGSPEAIHDIGGSINTIQFRPQSTEHEELLVISGNTEDGERGRGLILLRSNPDSLTRRLLRSGTLQLELDCVLGEGVIRVPPLGAYAAPDARSRDLKTSDNRRLIMLRDRRSISFVDQPSGKTVFTQRMPLDVIDMALSPASDQLAILMHEPGRGVSAEIWDIRTPAQRRDELQTQWAERVPAGAYLDKLWSGEVPTDDIRDEIVKDASLTPLRRLVAVQMLQERLAEAKAEAERTFAAITKEQTDAAAVRAESAAVELHPRVKVFITEWAEKWEYKPPEVSDAEKLAEETKRARLAEAEVGYRVAKSEELPIPATITLLESVVRDKTELLGVKHLSTASATFDLGRYHAFHQGETVGLDEMEAAIATRLELLGGPDATTLFWQSFLIAGASDCVEVDRVRKALRQFGEMLPTVVKSGERLRVYGRLPIPAATVDERSVDLFSLDGGPLDPTEVERIAQQCATVDGPALDAAVVDQAITWMPTKATTHEELAMLDRRLERLVVLAPSRPEFHAQLGAVNFRRGILAEAVSHLEAAESLNKAANLPTGPRTLGYMAMSYFRSDRVVEAVDTLARVRALMADPAHAETWAKDENARALVTEAVALIDGGGK